MTGFEAIEFIHSVSNFFCKPGLERISALCAALGNPQDSLKFVHIAGTNGKGSFCAFLSEILMSAGYKVGRYTSPYILEFNERIAVNGEPIGNDALARIAEQVKNASINMTDKPTEFEVITAIGFKYFSEMGCDIVVLECGLGGRLDATNIIGCPELSVITGVDFDHQNFLGDTIEEIAREKAGIIKNNTPILWCGKNETAKAIITAEAAEKEAPLHHLCHSDIKVTESTLGGTAFEFEHHKNLKIKMLGSYQPENAAAAIKAAELLRDSGWQISDGDIKNGLSAARWQARFEMISADPVVIFDGGHNPQGVTAAVESIKKYFGNRKVNILSGVMADKDYRFIAGKIGEVAAAVYTITAPNPRALTAEAYAKEFETLGIPATAYRSIEAAVQAAVENSSKTDTPLICLGSLYMYGDIYRLIKK